MAAIDHMGDSHILEREVEEEVCRQIVVEESILAMRTMMLPLPPRKGLRLPERGRCQLPLASGSWTEGMRLSSRSARRLPMDPGGL